MFVSPQIHILESNPQLMGFEDGGLWQVIRS